MSALHEYPETAQLLPALREITGAQLANLSPSLGFALLKYAPLTTNSQDELLKAYRIEAKTEARVCRNGKTR